MANCQHRKIFSCLPEAEATAESELNCARQIVSRLTTEAYRRPVNNSDIQPLLAIFERARKDVGFRASIATTLQALLVSPQFLYLQEIPPADVEPGSIYRISDTEFAARLALFLWSSLPDEELTTLASGHTKVSTLQARQLVLSGRVRPRFNRFL